DLAADFLQHRLDGIAGVRRNLLEVVAHVAALGWRLATPARLDRLPEEVDLTARVVEVVLLPDCVTGEAQQPCDRVAVGTVAGGADRDRTGRVGGDELDLDALMRLREPAPVFRVDLRERVDEPLAREPEVEESRPRHVRAVDRRQGGHTLREPLCELSRLELAGGRGSQGDVGRVVAVRGIVRPLELHLRPGDLRDLNRQALDGVTGQRPPAARRGLRALAAPRAFLPRSSRPRYPAWHRESAWYRRTRPACEARRSTRPSPYGCSDRGSSSRRLRTSASPRSLRNADRERSPPSP